MNHRTQTLIRELHELTRGTLRSYSQIFFSENVWLALPLLMVSFFDISSGFCGLIATLTANSIALRSGFDSGSVSNGSVGFNALLIGLGIGYYYDLSPMIVLIAMTAGFLSFILTLSFRGILGKYYLPYLSVPFVLGFWIVLPAVSQIEGMLLNQGNLFLINSLFKLGGHPMLQLHEWWVSIMPSGFLNHYLLSLGALFFQYNALAGLVIAITLLVYSRIAFTLSLMGYAVAFFAFQWSGLDMTQLGYSYIGFNFILGAIAIGGYFYIPSGSSYFWAFAITPVIALVTTGFTGLLQPLHLALLSLPFNLVVIGFIYSFRFRNKVTGLTEVVVQEGSPENNLYSSQSFIKRFPEHGRIHISLPFFNEWTINQAFDGEYTHKGEWKYAWDFVITNSEGKEYKDEGLLLSDYYCWDQNVIAPADGTIVMIDDHIEDNAVGMIDEKNNWGNTIIIQHADFLYSKLSHLRKDSFLVKKGDRVKRGQLIARAGNSGRSPYPHLHFQLQSTPYIGATTLKYPLHGISIRNKPLQSFCYPGLNDKVQVASSDPLMTRFFDLITGSRLVWNSLPGDKKAESHEWEVRSTPANVQYIYCTGTGSSLYFRNDALFFCCTGFDGDRNSLLYHFYNAAFRIPLTTQNEAISDQIPLHLAPYRHLTLIHDFSAPFGNYINVKYLHSIEKEGAFEPSKITIKVQLEGVLFRRKIWNRSYNLCITDDQKMELNIPHLNTTFLCKK